VRTHIDIDDNLMQKEIDVSGCKTKKETVEEGLKLIVTMGRQSGIRQFRGKLQWEGNLDKMRVNK